MNYAVIEIESAVSSVVIDKRKWNRRAMFKM